MGTKGTPEHEGLGGDGSRGRTPHRRRAPCCIDEAVRYLRETLNGSLGLGGEFLAHYNRGYEAGFADGKKDRERGQALVELTLVVTVMLFLALGALDLGRAYYAQVTVRSAAKEAAFAAATGSAPAVVAARAVGEASGGFVTVKAADVSATTCPAHPTLGTFAAAHVTGRLVLLSPLLGAFFGGQTMTFTGDATTACAVAP